jgi:hypothetical protein
LLEASLDSALNFVGIIEETGSNDGELIVKFLRSVGRKKGEAYCAAGQYYCFYIAALAMNLGLEDIPLKRTGLANAMFDEAKKKGRKVRFFANKHDLIIWRRNSTPFGHTERILETQNAGWVLTIAFNTSQYIKGKGRVEGIFIKRRNIFLPLGKMRVRGIIGFYCK